MAVRAFRKQPTDRKDAAKPSRHDRINNILSHIDAGTWEPAPAKDPEEAPPMPPALRTRAVSDTVPRPAKPEQAPRPASARRPSTAPQASTLTLPVPSVEERMQFSLPRHGRDLSGQGQKQVQIRACES